MTMKKEYTLKAPSYLTKTEYPCNIRCFWRGARAVEGARLESVCAVSPYRGFESLSLRHDFAPSVRHKIAGSTKRQESRLGPSRWMAVGKRQEGARQSLSGP